MITHYTRGAELISLSRPGEKHYYLHDGHGSVRALSDADGQVTDTYLFDAFGNLLTKTGTTANDFLYTGEQYDRSTGFYYLRARYMNPSTGTFTSPDAYAGTIFDPVSLHKYLYANANPVMWCDPTGNEATLKELGASMAISAILSAAEYGFMYMIAGSIDNEHGTDYQSRFSWQGLVKAMAWGAVSGAIGHWLKVAWIDEFMEGFHILARFMVLINLAMFALVCYLIGFNLPDKAEGGKYFLFALGSALAATATGGACGLGGFSQGFIDIVGDAPGFLVDSYDTFSGEVPNRDENEFSITSTDAPVPSPTPSPIPVYD